jgi:Flp pilus assembly protein TadB
MSEQLVMDVIFIAAIVFLSYIFIRVLYIAGAAVLLFALTAEDWYKEYKENRKIKKELKKRKQERRKALYNIKVIKEARNRDKDNY